MEHSAAAEKAAQSAFLKFHLLRISDNGLKRNDYHCQLLYIHPLSKSAENRDKHQNKSLLFSKVYSEINKLI